MSRKIANNKTKPTKIVIYVRSKNIHSEDLYKRQIGFIVLIFIVSLYYRSDTVKSNTVNSKFHLDNFVFNS